MKRSEEEKRKDFENAFRRVGIDENDRLGVGHPLLNQSKLKSTGLGVLGKRIIKGQKVDGTAESERNKKEDEEEEEEIEESRSTAVGKGKSRTYQHDLLTKRKKSNMMTAHGLSYRSQFT